MTTNTDPHGAMPELLPCPFCGVEPEIINFSVHCNNAYCEAQPFTAGQFVIEAIGAWNRRAAIQQAAGAVPEVEPTPEMCAAGLKVFGLTGGNLREHRYDFGTSKIIECFKAMLAASPAPPKQQPDHLAGGECGGVPLSDEQIERFAVEYEAFGFGRVDEKGFTTHGFDPDGLGNFARALLEAAHGIGNAPRPPAPTGQINPDSAGQGKEAGV